MTFKLSIKLKCKPNPSLKKQENKTVIERKEDKKIDRKREIERQREIKKHRAERKREDKDKNDK